VQATDRCSTGIILIDLSSLILCTSVESAIGQKASLSSSTRPWKGKNCNKKLVYSVGLLSVAEPWQSTSICGVVYIEGRE
jgi:hypothetical protein